MRLGHLRTQEEKGPLSPKNILSLSPGTTVCSVTKWESFVSGGAGEMTSCRYFCTTVVHHPAFSQTHSEAQAMNSASFPSLRSRDAFLLSHSLGSASPLTATSRGGKLQPRIPSYWASPQHLKQFLSTDFHWTNGINISLQQLFCGRQIRRHCWPPRPGHLHFMTHTVG